MELACAVRQARPCVLALCKSRAKVVRCSKGHTWISRLHTALFTLHTSHFTLHHLSHLIWALLSSGGSDTLCCKDQTPHCTLHISFHLVLSAISSRHLISPYLFSHAGPLIDDLPLKNCDFSQSLQNYQRGVPHFPRWGPPRYRRCTSSLPPSPLSFRVRLDPATPSAASPGKVMAGCQSITTLYSCLKKVPSV